MKIQWWKVILILAVAAWALFYVWPRAERPVLNMSLGLDLKGGSRLVMQVVTDDAVRATADVEVTRVQEQLRKEGFADIKVTPGQEVGQIVISPVPAGREAQVEDLLETELQQWSLSTSGNTVTATMGQAEMNYHRENAVKQALTTIRNRIDQFGVGETNIQQLGGEQKNRVLVELPGLEDPTRVKGIIQTQARLELRLAYYTPDGQGPVIGATAEEVQQALGGQLPAGVEVLPYEDTDETTGQKTRSFWAVQRSSAITGGDLARAEGQRDQQTGQWIVSFQLRANAADRFARFTRANIGKHMPIILDDKIISAPTINDEIGMRGQITGNFTEESSKDLALTLRAGALPARVMTVEERTVGPSLGADSIRSGLMASGIAAAFTCLFMVVYYKRAGINAVVTMALNMLILFAAMAQLGAALTLPGIAGLALTIGMAVDANVLIFERMREEQRAGRTVTASVASGFGKALSAILDSNLTTIISAAFLLQYGTGPVKGFAVTLIIGLMANMFTAVFVSRTIFEINLAMRPNMKRLSV